jgi:pyoverdine/dityrosine biosynthesis protein Dit1
MVLQKGYTQIDFSRIRDLVDFPLPDKLDEIKYVANATNFRRSLLNKFGKEDHDIDSEIQQKPDTLMTYRGYCRFLESDLQYIFPLQSGRTSNGYKRSVKFLAKEMLIRGFVRLCHSFLTQVLIILTKDSSQAFAGAVKAAFPDHLRLSIHESTGEHKLSMALLNSKTGYTTPWHCTVALMNDGEWMSAPMGFYKNDPTMEVVEEDGRPSYFKQKGGVNGDASN